MLTSHLTPPPLAAHPTQAKLIKVLSFHSSNCRFVAISFQFINLIFILRQRSDHHRAVPSIHLPYRFKHPSAHKIYFTYYWPLTIRYFLWVDWSSEARVGAAIKANDEWINSQWFDSLTIHRATFQTDILETTPTVEDRITAIWKKSTKKYQQFDIDDDDEDNEDIGAPRRPRRMGWIWMYGTCPLNDDHFFFRLLFFLLLSFASKMGVFVILDFIFMANSIII